MATASERSGGYILSTIDLMVGILFIVLIIVFYFAYINAQNLEELRENSKLIKKWETIENESRALLKENYLLRDKIKEASTDIARLKTQLKEEKDNNSNVKKDLDKAKKKLEKTMEERNAAVKNLERYRELYAQISVSRLELLNKISALSNAKGFGVKVDAKRGIIRLPQGDLFSTGKIEFSRNGIANMKIITEVLKEVLPCYVGAPYKTRFNSHERCDEVKFKIEAVFLEGHADIQKVTPNAAYKDNYELAAKRALTAFKLINADTRLRDMRNQKGEFLFGVSGYGETRPICQTEKEECFKLNRRIDLRFMMQVPENMGK